MKEYRVFVRPFEYPEIWSLVFMAEGIKDLAQQVDDYVCELTSNYVVVSVSIVRCQVCIEDLILN